MAFSTFGTLSTLDTLASNFQTIAQYGEDHAYEDFAHLLAAHNNLVTDLMGELVEVTQERLARYGTATLMTMEEMDEFGSPHPQKTRAGSTVGFPLRSYQGGLQWTKKFMENQPVAEWAAQITSMFGADLNNIGRAIKSAIFSGVNYSWNDYLVDNLQSGAELPCKALANADGAEIPAGPNGESFDGSTHTHYLYAATLTDAHIKALILTIVEHFADGQLKLYINRAQETAIRALTGSSGDFVPYLDARLTSSDIVTAATGRSLNVTNVYNRAIGLYQGAEVWVKPWVPANYQFVFMQGQPKPLRFRERRPGTGILQLLGEEEAHPLRCRFYEREFGVSVWNRVSAAVGYSNSGSSYASPTVTGSLA